MKIDHHILLDYGGVVKKYTKGEYIFQEGSVPYHYYQLLEGEVKVFSTNDEGKELIQGIFSANQSFGEPPLLLRRIYPSTAEASKDCVVVKMRFEQFKKILDDHPNYVMQLMYTFAERIYSKAKAVQVWVQQTPEEKILRFLENHKLQLSEVDEPLPFTRQQIADYVGLRVETVIRTLSKMSKEGKIRIIDHKLYY